MALSVSLGAREIRKVRIWSIQQLVFTIYLGLGRAGGREYISAHPTGEAGELASPSIIQLWQDELVNTSQLILQERPDKMVITSQLILQEWMENLDHLLYYSCGKINW